MAIPWICTGILKLLHLVRIIYYIISIKEDIINISTLQQRLQLEVVSAYMAGDKSTIELSAEYNVVKSTISEWIKKYGEKCQYTVLP